MGADDALERERGGRAPRARPLEGHGDRTVVLDACQLDVAAIRNESRPDLIECRAYSRLEERGRDRLNLVRRFS